ncbi:MAG: hypothetical protein ACR5LF_06705 [Symbiopectobacterium sp.]
MSLTNALNTLCAQRNIRLRPFPSEHDAMTEEQMSSSLQGMRQSGIMIVNDERIPLLQTVVKSGIPAVLINGRDPAMRLNRVTHAMPPQPVPFVI